MTPREKAKEFRQLFAQELIDLTDNEDLLNSRIKNCALIAVEEVIEALDVNCWQNADLIIYWNEVKQEIEKL
jgi:hypothetical protein